MLKDAIEKEELWAQLGFGFWDLLFGFRVAVALPAPGQIPSLLVGFLPIPRLYRVLMCQFLWLQLGYP